MVTHVKRLDPRVKRTHQLLQQALLELMQAKRFASITVHDIAERARLNRATFYAHFEDKYHLLDALIREQFQQEVASTLSCLANHRTPIEGLYISGAGTNPTGGIAGTPGRLAAQALLTDQGR